MRAIPIIDRWGAPLQGENEEGADLFANAVEDLVSLRGDPTAGALSAIAADGDLVLAHILLAYLALYGTSAEGASSALGILENSEGAANARERLHLDAARSWALGRWEEATASLERLLQLHPRDLLALKVAQDLYFFLGRSEELQNVVTRVVKAWSPETEGWGYIQGMLAFGLEENGHYRQAEICARAALDHNWRDTWATHALVHVFEMQGRQSEGISFVTESAGSWSTSFFAVHNWWHCALFRLELGEIDEVTALYDGPIRSSRTTEWLDLVDAASLLWRLSLFGIDVSNRVSELSADIEPLVDEPIYLFNDWHAIMALGLARRHDLCEDVIASESRAVGTNRLVAEQGGLILLEGFSAFAAGRYDRAVKLLATAMPSAGAVGGSHAQRDIVELTLIAAAVRAGQGQFAQALIGGRIARKPNSAEAVRSLVLANDPVGRGAFHEG